ncbi:MAG: alpha/beta fold hydrolase [Anaerolineae bacterium]|nr:alpha/beta fold hydrolase [Anaerolineae bacterium]
MRFARRLVVTLATGCILMFYSESMFWARYRPGEDSLGSYLTTWIVYSLSAFVFLSLVSLLRVRNIWALFLCGALFGWLTEGVVVQTMYDDFPLNISFTGLAWHALISVLIGWYGVRKTLLENRIGKTCLVAGLVGLFWGFWGICWRVEEPATAATVIGFARFSITANILLIAAYRLYDRFVRDAFPPTKVELIVVGILAVLYFVFVTIPANFLALIILPPLVLIVSLTLWKNRRIEEAGSLIDSLVGHVHPVNHLCLLLMALVASAFYWITDLINLQVHTNWIVYLVTMPLGAIMLVASLVRIWTGRPFFPGAQHRWYWPGIIRLVAICLSVFALLGLIGVGRTLDAFVTQAIHPTRVPITRAPADMGIAGYQDVSFVTVDGLELRGWYIPSRSGAAVILGHGHAGNREQMMLDAQILTQHGYGVLLFDWRAHGESEGDMTTFGLYEVQDLEAAVDYVSAQPEVDREKIGVIGFSMGGATATLGASRDQRIKALIIEGAYAVFGDTARERLKWLPLVGQVGILWGKLTTGVDPDAVRPVDAICAISPRPVLLIYGTLEDGAIAPGSARQMFDAACDPKELWMIEGARHGGYAATVPEEYEQRIVAFFDESLMGQTGP